MKVCLRVFWGKINNEEGREMRAEELGILIIDDEKNIQITLQDVLEYYGFKEVYLASNGEEGVETLKEILQKGYKYELVLTDRNMGGGMLGEEVVRYIKSRFPEVRVAMMSAADPKVVRPVALAAGADGFLEKPIGMQDLIQMIRSLFGAA